MSIPSMVKRSEKTFILFCFEEKKGKKRLFRFALKRSEKFGSQAKIFLEAKQSEITLY
jgi:hypothetical protein